MALVQRQSPYSHWEFTNPSTGDLLRVVPERGGLITGWRCAQQEVIYLDLDRFLDPSQSIRGGMPILFPICGGLPHNILPLPQGDFELKQHGFARDLPWLLETLDDGQGIALVLEDTEATHAAYPFQFRVRLEVRLAALALEISTRIENRGEGTMPFSFGLHPYFNISNLQTLRFEGLPEHCLNHLSMADALSAEQMDCLNDGVDLLVRPQGSVRLVDPDAGCSLELQASHPMDLVVIWTEPPRKMVCLEPWTGPRQALISGDRKLELSAGQACTLQSRYVFGPPQ